MSARDILEKGNHENDWAAAQEAAVDGNMDEPFLTESVMSDVNGERTHPGFQIPVPWTLY